MRELEEERSRLFPGPSQVIGPFGGVQRDRGAIHEKVIRLLDR